MDDVNAWVSKGRDLLERCFGSDSRNAREFAFAGVNAYPDHDAPAAWDELHAKTLNFQLKLIVNCIELLGIQAEAGRPQPAREQGEAVSDGKVFLVHGRNEGARNTVARFLEGLDLQLVILQEQADKGRTVIEKFLDHSSEVGFAVVLLTADDRGGPKDGEYEDQSYRARQNVWLELGFFIGKLGRPRVCALWEEGVEIPSDYRGVLFVPSTKRALGN